MAQPHSFPVFKILRQTLRSVLTNIGYLLRIGWLPMLLFVAVEQFDNAMGYSSRHPVGLLLDIPAVLAQAPLAVAWHRFVLLNERRDGWFNLRYDQTTLWFAFYLFIVETVIYEVVEFSSQLLLSVGERIASNFVGAPSWLITFVLALYITQRLSLVFPAIAINKQGFGLKQSWQMAKGNSIRFFVGSLGLFLLVVLLMLALVAADGWLMPESEEDLAYLLMFIMIAILIPLLISYLSYSYRFLRQEAAASPTTEPQ